MYSLWSDSESAFGDSFQVLGSGFVVGVRNVFPMPTVGSYAHSINLGIDYKDFDETVGYDDGEEGYETPVSYFPISVTYSGVKSDGGGYTQISFGLNFLFRGLAGDYKEFEDKRTDARANYLFTKASIERFQLLPVGFTLDTTVEGQISSQPLISNEQYIAGGMDSVRGYKESEVTGDNAVHASVEIGRPFQALTEEKWGGINITPYLFYDGAWLKVIDPLQGQDENLSAQGAGVGMRGTLFGKLEFQVDYAEALVDSEDVASGEREFYFKVKGQF
jgi:hemolysin activation/secretion protein